jgi:recombinational DNA repair protein (RecF pathway)
MPTRCSQCHAEVETGEAHLHHAKVLCEECWMEVRATPTRKTHWQYLQSIKTEYLIRFKKD